MCTIKNFFEGATGNFAESHTEGMKTLQIFAVRVMCVRTMDIFIHKNIKHQSPELQNNKVRFHGFYR